METIEIILNFMICIPLITFVILCFLLLREVDDCRDEIKYLKSVCEQAVEVSTKAENEAKEAKKLTRYHIDHHYKIAQKSFYQGRAMGRKENEK